MKPLLQVMANPSGWDGWDNYAGERPDPSWLVLLTQTRDSDALAESNFACALEALGGEGENVQVFRFGHWACGWWEALCVRQGSEKEQPARDMFNALLNYPVLDEEDFSRRELEAEEDAGC